MVFDSPDGLKIHGQLFLPPPGRAARGPALLFFHGGPTRQMLLGWHPMDAYAYMYALNQYLASEGYVVLSVNYRGGTGYGLSFREAKNFGPAGSSELNDIQGAATFLRARADVDPKRIGMGRQLRRPDDRARPVAVLGPVGRWRRLRRRPQLEHAGR